MKKFIVYFCIFILFIAGVSISFAATEKGSAEKSDEDIRIGLAIANMSNPYMIILGEEGKKKMAELGLDPQQLLIRDPQDDVTKQIHHIENFISQGVDVIIVQACDSDAIVPAVKDANRAGIPVVCLTRPVNGGEVMQLARTDNISGSREITDAICKAMTTLGKTKATTSR